MENICPLLSFSARPRCVRQKESKHPCKPHQTPGGQAGGANGRCAGRSAVPQDPRNWVTGRHCRCCATEMVVTFLTHPAMKTHRRRAQDERRNSALSDLRSTRFEGFVTPVTSTIGGEPGTPVPLGGARYNCDKVSALCCGWCPPLRGDGPQQRKFELRSAATDRCGQCWR